jgi:hypothetical protein
LDPRFRVPTLGLTYLTGAGSFWPSGRAIWVPRKANRKIFPKKGK